MGARKLLHASLRTSHQSVCRGSRRHEMLPPNSEREQNLPMQILLEKMPPTALKSSGDFVTELCFNVTGLLMNINKSS